MKKRLFFHNMTPYLHKIKSMSKIQSNKHA